MAEGSVIRVVAVIGAGEQGRAFALRCARAGFSTVLEDVMPAKLRQAQAELTVLSGRDADGSDVADRLSFALTVEEAVREADLAVDFVPDELESKLEIFSMIDRMAPPKTILCTPTQALSIGDLAACTYRADRCIAIGTDGAGLQANFLRLVRGRMTSDSVLRRTQAWLAALGTATEITEDNHADAPAAVV